MSFVSSIGNHGPTIQLATDIEAVHAAIRAYRAIAERSGADLELAANMFGYRLMQRGKLDDARAVFEANVEDHPDSWNVYDSLAEAFMESGETQRAIELYEHRSRSTRGTETPSRSGSPLRTAS